MTIALDPIPGAAVGLASAGAVYGATEERIQPWPWPWSVGGG